MKYVIATSIIASGNEAAWSAGIVIPIPPPPPPPPFAPPPPPLPIMPVRSTATHVPAPARVVDAATAMFDQIRAGARPLRRINNSAPINRVVVAVTPATDAELLLINKARQLYEALSNKASNVLLPRPFISNQPYEEYKSYLQQTQGQKRLKIAEEKALIRTLEETQQNKINEILVEAKASFENAKAELNLIKAEQPRLIELETNHLNTELRLQEIRLLRDNVEQQIAAKSEEIKEIDKEAQQVLFQLKASYNLKTEEITASNRRREDTTALRAEARGIRDFIEAQNRNIISIRANGGLEDRVREREVLEHNLELLKSDSIRLPRELSENIREQQRVIDNSSTEWKARYNQTLYANKSLKEQDEAINSVGLGLLPSQLAARGLRVNTSAEQKILPQIRQKIRNELQEIQWRLEQGLYDIDNLNFVVKQFGSDIGKVNKQIKINNDINSASNTDLGAMPIKLGSMITWLPINGLSAEQIQEVKSRRESLQTIIDYAKNIAGGARDITPGTDMINSMLFGEDDIEYMIDSPLPEGLQNALDLRAQNIKLREVKNNLRTKLMTEGVVDKILTTIADNAAGLPSQRPTPPLVEIVPPAIEGTTGPDIIPILPSPIAERATALTAAPPPPPPPPPPGRATALTAAPPPPPPPPPPGRATALTTAPPPGVDLVHDPDAHGRAAPPSRIRQFNIADIDMAGARAALRRSGRVERPREVTRIPEVTEADRVRYEQALAEMSALDIRGKELYASLVQKADKEIILPQFATSFISLEEYGNRLKEKVTLLKNDVINKQTQLANFDIEKAAKVEEIKNNARARLVQEKENEVQFKRTHPSYETLEDISNNMNNIKDSLQDLARQHMNSERNLQILNNDITSVGTAERAQVEVFDRQINRVNIALNMMRPARGHGTAGGVAIYRPADPAAIAQKEAERDALIVQKNALELTINNLEIDNGLEEKRAQVTRLTTEIQDYAVRTENDTTRLRELENQYRTIFNTGASADWKKQFEKIKVKVERRTIENGNIDRAGIGQEMENLNRNIVANITAASSTLLPETRAEQKALLDQVMKKITQQKNDIINTKEKIRLLEEGVKEVKRKILTNSDINRYNLTVEGRVYLKIRELISQAPEPVATTPKEVEYIKQTHNTLNLILKYAQLKADGKTDEALEGEAISSMLNSREIIENLLKMPIAQEQQIMAEEVADMKHILSELISEAEELLREEVLRGTSSTEDMQNLESNLATLKENYEALNKIHTEALVSTRVTEESPENGNILDADSSQNNTASSDEQSQENNSTLEANSSQDNTTSPDEDSHTSSQHDNESKDNTIDVKAQEDIALQETLKLIEAQKVETPAILSSIIEISEVAGINMISNTLISISSIHNRLNSLYLFNAPQQQGQPDLPSVGMAAGDENNNVPMGIWISGLYGKSKQGAIGALSSYKSNATGFTLGLDAELDESLVGAAYSNIRSNSKLENDSKIKSQSHVLLLYGQKALNNNFFVSGIVNMLRGYTKVTRKVNNAFYNGDLKYINYGFESILNYNYNAHKGIRLIPYVGLRYGRNVGHTYNETGVEIKDLSLSIKSSNVWTGIVGSRIVFNPWQATESVKVSPSLHGSIEYNMSNKRGSARLTASAARNIDQEVALPRQSAIKYNIGGGLLAEKDNIKLLVEYNCNLHKKYQGHQGFIRLRIGF